MKNYLVDITVTVSVEIEADNPKQAEGYANGVIRSDLNHTEVSLVTIDEIKARYNLDNGKFLG